MSTGRLHLYPWVENAVARANDAAGETFAFALELIEDQAGDGVGGGGHPSGKAHIRHGEALTALVASITGWEPAA